MLKYEMKTLSELSTDGKGHYGIAAPAVEYSESLPTYLRITDINDDGTIDYSGLKSVSDDNASDFFLKSNDIVFARTGASTGRNYFYDGTDGKFVYAGFLIKFSIDEKKVNPRYVKYYCMSKSYRDWVSSFSSGSTRGNINAQTYGNMPILLPSRPQQDFLVKVLSALDDKIELNNQINKNLEEQAQSIFKRCFIDNEESLHWENATFSNLVVSTISGDWGKDSPSGNNKEEVYCIRGADIPEVQKGNIGKMPIRYILSKNLLSKQLSAGDIVVEISGGSPTQSTGRCASITQSLLNRYGGKMICTNFCRAIKVVPGYSAFVYYYLRYLYDKGTFFAYENGTTGIKNLDLTGFLETESIMIPPKAKIEEFDMLSQSVFSQIYANGKQNDGLSKLRDTLLPKLMSGEIDVDNVEI